jgi:membrane protease YdiL (CAAX protease family)
MPELIFVAVLLCSSLVTWSILIVRRSAGRPWLAFQTHALVPWGLLDVFIALALLFILTPLVMTVLRLGSARAAQATAAPLENILTAGDILAQALASLATLALSMLVMRVRFRATAADLGWSTVQFRADLRLGVVAFLALAPPVYALQLLLVQWFESKHPLVELIRRDRQPDMILVSVLSAVIVAPLIEEYLFRGLLQGWLERLADGRDAPQHLMLGGPARRRSEPVPDEPTTMSEPAPPGTLPGDAANPYLVTALAGGPAAEFPSVARGATAPGAHWPIFVSALAFAVMHLSHGPDWIPLFLLALGLGYIYRQTHRLVPVIVVHFLLNACSLTMLLVS